MLPSKAGYDITGSSPNGRLNGSMLPISLEMEPEEGFPLREWRRSNAIRLEQKEKREKEMLQLIIEEADQFKVDFYKKRDSTVDSNKKVNREKEKMFLGSNDKFHAEAEKSYWRATAELIPHEVAVIQKRGKKDIKPGIVVIQGPKPGKPTDVSRMRQVILKLKHNPPTHMKPKPPSTASNGSAGTALPETTVSPSLDAVSLA